MAKVYNLPEGFKAKLPKLDFSNFDRNKYNADEQAFLNELAQWCKNRRNQVGVGEVIQFPVADSYAQYMVAGTTPVELIHLPLMDAWDFQYANRLTKKDVLDKIDQQNALKKLFANHKNK